MAKKVNKIVETSLLQAVGLVAYISLVSIIFYKGNQWFPKMNNYIGPVVFLTIFSVSALICALITLSQPFKLWQKGKLDEAMKLVSYTVVWVLIFLLLLLGVIIPRIF